MEIFSSVQSGAQFLKMNADGLAGFAAFENGATKHFEFYDSNGFWYLREVKA